MLGGLRAILGDRVITRFQTQKTGALLAFLALHHGKSFARERVAELLWPDGDASAIRNRLNQAVSSLRRQLHPPGVSPNAVLVADHQSISINPRVTTDVSEFQKLIQESLALEGDASVPTLRKAVDLHRGEFLQGSQEDWVATERLLLSDQCYEALTKLIRIYAYSGRLSDAIEVANRRLAQDPGEERSHRALMRLYVMANRPRSALAQFAEMERALAMEGDVPSERSLKLRAEAIAAAEAEVVQPTTGHDERPVAAEEAPTPKPWFPRYATPFFGRESEVASIREALEGKCKLVTLTGLGGVGKTRLAIEAVSILATEATTIAFVSVADIQAPAALLEELDNVASSVLRNKRVKRLIVVLDNIEPQVQPHLAGLPQFLKVNPLVSIVATARTPLGVDGELVFPVTPLPSVEEGGLVELAKAPAIAMFISRAQAVRQDFQLTERNCSAIVDLSRRLEGWPLAIELAAGWARSMTPSQMAERISQNYDLLASRRKDIDARHRSLRAAIDGSFAALSDEAKADFRRLSVFEGGWDRYAAAAVLPGSDVHQTLTTLEDAGLVRTDTSVTEPRYQMLESVRTFARDLTTPDLTSEVRRLHAEHFRSIVSRSTRRGPSGVVAIKRDRPNVLAALKYWIETGQTEFALPMAIDLGNYWELSGRIEEGISWLERALPLADKEHISDHGILLSRYARLLWSRGEFPRANTIYAQALELFERAEHMEGVLETTIYLAQDAHRQGHFKRSADLLATNIELAKQLGESWAEARSQLARGNSMVELGELGVAQQAYEECLRIGQHMEEASLIGASLGNLGNLMRLRGDLDQAEEYFNSASKIYEQAGLRAMTIEAHLMQAQLKLMKARPSDALSHVREALRIGVENAYQLWTAFLLGASAFTRLESYETAANLFGHAEELWNSGAERGVETEAYEAERLKLETAFGESNMDQALAAGRAMDHASATALILTERP